MELLTTLATVDFLGKPAWLWLSFIGIVIALLAIDLGLLHRDDHEIKVRESLLQSGAYIGMGLLFGAWVWWYLGPTSGMQYLTGFLVEKTLAMDNVFVIAMIFSFFAIPAQYQYRVLFWGILGVIVLRAIMIGLGAALIAEFSWVLYVFGAFLLATGIKMLIFIDKEFDIAGNPVLRWLQKRVRVTPTIHGKRFWVKLPADAYGAKPAAAEASSRIVWWATPLFFALVIIEVVDLIFAVDSVPAIFAITQDPFIVYTSNIFAILGLRALYFALAAMIERFRYLKYSLAAVLIFIGGEILLVNVLGKTPAWISLSVTVGLLAAGVLYSLYRTRSGASTTTLPVSPEKFS